MEALSQKKHSGFLPRAERERADVALARQLDSEGAERKLARLRAEEIGKGEPTLFIGRRGLSLRDSYGEVICIRGHKWTPIILATEAERRALTADGMAQRIAARQDVKDWYGTSAGWRPESGADVLVTPEPGSFFEGYNQAFYVVIQGRRLMAYGWRLLINDLPTALVIAGDVLAGKTPLGLHVEGEDYRMTPTAAALHAALSEDAARRAAQQRGDY